MPLKDAVDKLSPMLDPSESMALLPYHAWPYKPTLMFLHRAVAVYLQLLAVAAFLVIPLWALNAAQDDFYVAPKQGICAHLNRSTPMPSSSGDGPHCPVLTEEAVRDGWRLSPIQQHAHRYGAWYQIGIRFHILFACLLLLCELVVLCIFFAKFCVSAMARSVLEKIGACAHYVFMWVWVLMITVCLCLAITRLLTLGSDPEKWNWSFGMSFFFLFYFVVIVILINLSTLFHEDKWKLSAPEVYMRHLTLYTAQGLFLILLPVVICLNTQERIQRALGFSDYEVAVVTAVNLLLLEPFAGSLATICTGNNRTYRCISSCTLYWITPLTKGINWTNRVMPELTVPLILLLLALYLISLVMVSASCRATSKDLAPGLAPTEGIDGP